MDFTEAIAKLEALSKLEGAAAILGAEPEAAKATILERVEKQNKENKTLRTRATAAEDFKAHTIAGLGLAEDADVEAVLAAAKPAKGSGSGKETELQASVAKLTKQVEELTGKEARLQAEALAKSKAEAVTKALREHKIFEDAAQLFAGQVAGQFTQDAQGDWVREDGTTLKDWAAGFVKDKARYIEPAGKPGAGSQGAGGGGTAQGADLADKPISELLGMAIRGEGMPSKA